MPRQRRPWPRSGITFPLSPVEPATEPLIETATWEAVRRPREVLEAAGDYTSPVVYVGFPNALIGACCTAWAEHRPLVLSPDVIWTAITHGVAVHINKHAERLRSRLVAHSGKLELRVDRTDFVKGSPDNPWEEVFESFVAQIQEHSREAPRFLADFSTTGRVERAASCIVLMDAMQSFFQYVMRCVCGIPSLTLEGTTADWEALRERTREFERYGLRWWIRPLLKILGEFVKASRGDVDARFWNDIYQFHHTPREGYGAATCFMSGWIGMFFPYLEFGRANPQIAHFLPWRRGSACRVEPNLFQPICSRAPLQWEGELELVSGVLTVEQSPDTMALRPRVGWLVRESLR